jgi:hypothetical protein
MRNFRVSSVAIAFFLLLSTTTTLQAWASEPRTARPLPPPAGTKLPVEPVNASAAVVVNFQELAKRDALKPKWTGPLVPQMIHPPLETEEEEAPYVPPENPWTAPEGAVRSYAPSPSPSLSFAGMDDIAKVGSGYIVIPPDTDGAVGLTKVMVAVNNNYRIQDKATGATLSTVSIDTFWSATGGSGFFDPKTLYDPINDRWIVCVMSDGGSAASSVEVGVSLTSDPAGSYTLFKIDADALNTNWADFPCIGFNKNWVAINMNMFTISGGAYTSSKMLVVDYPSLRAGTLTSSFVTGTGFCTSPSATYSSTEATLYAPTHLSSSGGTYRLDTITGTPPASPTYTVGATKSRGLTWAQPGGNIVPQAAPLSGASVCGATPCKFDSGDAYIRTTPVVRGGYLYYVQTVGIPAGGLTHTGVQWTKLDASGGGSTGNVVDGGRVEDSTATATNGGKWYAYPHIAVNQFGDIILAFTQSSSSQYAASGYTVHSRTDGAGVMNDPVIFKAGEDYYHKDFGSGRNRWGDYSKAQVDPSDDTSLWVLQEYAKARVGTDDGTSGSNSSRWATWWAKLSPALPPETADGSSSATAMSWTGTTSLTWPVNSSATSGYKLYRGDQSGLANLLTSATDSCLRFTGANQSANTASGLSEDPVSASGRFYWYLVTGLDLFGEGSAGNATAGPRIVNSSGACP